MKRVKRMKTAENAAAQRAGAVVGEAVQMTGQGDFHYDEALGRINRSRKPIVILKLPINTFLLKSTAGWVQYATHSCDGERSSVG